MIHGPTPLAGRETPHHPIVLESLGSGLSPDCSAQSDLGDFRCHLHPAAKFLAAENALSSPLDQLGIATVVAAGHHTPL